MNESGITNTSGDGSRPTTSGGTDNIGAADGFVPGKAKPAGTGTPAAAEKMSDKRQDGDAPQANHPAPHDLS
ncbi:MAG: hypothetical protein JWP47_2694 [Polaromonas sp.]|jgi:hypothetical protein|nr:hypothetical protein [Polaromonas sp.]